MNLRAVIFDMDDTLYPERTYVRSGFRAVAAWAQQELGLAAESSFAELCRLFHEGVRGDTFDRWMDSHGIDKSRWVPAAVQSYRLHDPQITPYPGAQELLVRLRDRYALALVTDGSRQVQERKLAALGLTDCFDAVVFSDAWGREAWKPSPRPFEAAMERLAQSGADAVYVADNPVKDFRGARHVGMKTVRIRHADGLYHDMEAGSSADAPDWEVATFDRLERLLAEKLPVEGMRSPNGQMSEQQA